MSLAVSMLVDLSTAASGRVQTQFRASSVGTAAGSGLSLSPLPFRRNLPGAGQNPIAPGRRVQPCISGPAASCGAREFTATSAWQRTNSRSMQCWKCVVLAGASAEHSNAAGHAHAHPACSSSQSATSGVPTNRRDAIERAPREWANSLARSRLDPR